MDINYISRRLEQIGVSASVLSNYHQEHRVYHTLEHILYVLKKLESKGVLDDDILFLAAVFHDIVYLPLSESNEEDSAHFFQSHYHGNTDLRDEVIDIILDTKTHKGRTEKSRLFCECDRAILNEPLEVLIQYERQIFKEFQVLDWKLYKKIRLEWLENNAEGQNIEALKSYLRTFKPHIGVYAGSFNPFHLGHFNILQKAENIFDKVIIAYGKNTMKNAENWEKPKGLWYRQQEDYSGLLTDFIHSLEYPVTVIRGLRNGTDLQYELDQYRYLTEMMPDIKVVSLFCDREFAHLSSTFIRSLKNFDKDKDYLLP